MISYHVLIDQFPNLHDNRIQEFNSHLIRLKPEYINIMGGSKFEQTLQYVEHLYNIIPDTRIILRRWPDDGNIRKYNHDMHAWYNSEIKPYRWWLDQQINKGQSIIWLLDNESASDNLTNYAKASSQAMHICAEFGLGLAIGRFATGNPKEHQYSQLDEMWQTLKFYNDLHIFSPNEYFDKPNALSGVGSVNRYQLAWERCQEKFNFTPKTVIGEFGLALNYDPHKGWRTTGLPEADYANLCLEYDRQWYTPNQITACVFSVGNWHGFDVTKTFYNKIEVHMNEWSKPIDVKPIPVTTAICFENYVRIRDKPVNGKIIGYIHKNGCVDVLENKTGISKQGEWIKIKFNNIIGYCAAWFFVSCEGQYQIQSIKENNMLDILFEIVKNIVTNRKYMAPIISLFIAILINQFPDLGIDPEIWTERIFQLILLLVTGDIVYDVVNVAKDNNWNNEERNWE